MLLNIFNQLIFNWSKYEN